MFKSTLITLVALLVTGSAIAETYDIDASHSRVGFKISHLAISNVLGTFDDFSGTIQFDPEKIEASSTEVQIQATSVNTNNEKRDKHLNNEDFFQTEKFPLLKFKSSSVRKIDAEHFKLIGELTIKETTKPVTLDVTYKGNVKDPWGNDRVGFMATTSLNRKDYGISWNKSLDSGGLVLGDEVQIEIEIEGIKKQA